MTHNELHQTICAELSATYQKKNAAYGDAFGQTYRKLGPISALTRIQDKNSRLVSLMTNPNIDDLGESIEDTLLDMANYCIMTVMEMRWQEAEE